MNINHSKLREMDYVITTSLYPIACSIRYFSTGKLFDTSIGTHVGMLISIKNKLFMAEMLPEGLRINSLKKYCLGGFFEARIVCVKRNPIYYQSDIQKRQSEQIVSDYFETLKYDFKGVLSYVWNDLRERPEKFYCSEYVNKYAFEAGFPIKLDKCTPYDIQTCKGLEDVKFT